LEKASPVEQLSDQTGGGLSLRHVPWVITRPSALFARVEDTGAYGSALVTLLALLVLLGYAKVQTGLIDRVVDQQTESRLAELEQTQYGLVDKLELKDAMDNVRKAGQFNKMIQRLAAVVITPVGMLASFLLISSVLYAAVALSGRKPEWHTLMAICVYAGFIDLAAYGLRLAMMLAYRTTQVDTSLRMLSEPDKPSPWAGVDPFRIWYWVLVVMGLTITRQLSRRAAVAACSVMFGLATAMIIALEYAPRKMGM
jgi:hypothetical protein